MHALWILIGLIVISGFFALSEMALASSRRSKLSAMAEAGNHKARLALNIIDHPSRLLAATQTGITAAALENHLMSNVLRLEDRRLASVMTPVSDVRCAQN